MLLCKICNFEYNHLLGTINVVSDDDNNVHELVVNESHSFPASNLKYQYRTQGNIHLLFSCEDGHLHFKSYDGHKGNIHQDENELINKLESYLNNIYKDKEKLTLEMDYELLGNIENFIKDHN